MDAATGEIGWSASLEGEVTGGISVADGRILAGNAEGEIVAVGEVEEPSPSPSQASTGVREAHVVRTLEAPGGFETALDVAFDAGGDAWVTEGASGTVTIVSPEGEFIERWGTRGSADGQFDFAVPGSADPTGSTAFLPDGGFWITDPGNDRIPRFDADRDWVASVGHFGTGDGQFQGQTYLALDDRGSGHISDGARGDIQVFTADGAYERTIPVQPDPDPAYRWGSRSRVTGWSSRSVRPSPC